MLAERGSALPDDAGRRTALSWLVLLWVGTLSGGDFANLRRAPSDS
jgi:hypothetical protein